MKYLLLLSLISCVSQETHYIIPKTAKHYILQRQVVGYTCPKGYYHDLPSNMCMPNKLTAFLELGTTELNINSHTMVEQYDTDTVEVNRE